MTDTIPLGWKFENDQLSDEDLLNLLQSSYPVLQRLQTIVKKKIDQHYKKMNTDFTEAAWAEKQAYLLGYVSAMRDVEKLTQIRRKDQ